MRFRPLNSRCRPRGLTTAPESRCEPGALPFSSTATGTSPSRAAVSGFSSISCPSRIAAASPAGPAPTIRNRPRCARRPGRSAAAIASARRPRRREVGGPNAHDRARANELGQLRDDLVQVADDAEVGELEDRRVRILVDRDDHVRALHPDLVLDRAGDPERDVQLRRHGLAGLTDLRRIRVPPRVDDRPCRGDRAAERLRELLGERELLRLAEPASAGDDHVGILDRRPLLLGMRLLDHLGARREVLQLDRGILHLGCATDFVRVERAARNIAELTSLDQPTSTNTVSRELRRPPPSRRRSRRAPSSAPRRAAPRVPPRVGSEHRLREQHRVESLVARRASRARRHEAAAAAPRPLVVGDPHRRRAVCARARRHLAHARTDDDACDLAADLRRLRQDAERAFLRSRLRGARGRRASSPSDEPLLDEELEDLLRARSVVLDLLRLAARRAAG